MNEKPARREAGIDIRDHLPDEDRRAAAVIYYSGLEAKLAPVFGPAATALTVLPGCLQASRCLTAYEGNRLTGVLGLHDSRGGVLAPPFATMIRHYGPLFGMLRLGLLMTMDHTPPPGDLYLDGIAVAAAYRGRGIGTALIQAFERRAVQNGFDTVSLEVIETNRRAHALYIRLGYSEVAVHGMGPFSRLFGFGSTCRFMKHLAAPTP